MSVQSTNVTFSEAIASVPFRADVVHQAVVAYLSGARQGSVKQKTRAEVSGGGRKPWRQKGTGRARAGSTRSPIWTGGGITFANRGDRNYNKKINRKVYRLAMKSLLAELLRRGDLIVLNEFKAEEVSTKKMTQKLKDLGLQGRLLFVDTELDENAYLSSRNIPNFLLIDTLELNPYFLSVVDKVVLTEAALKQIEERFAS